MMSHSEPIRLLIVDDHYFLREGLAAILKLYPDVTVIGEAENGVQAVELCKTLNPDVVLMDLMMPKMGGIEAAQSITKVCTNTKIIILSAFSDEETVFGAIHAGAISYLLKNVTADELVNAIRAAARKKSVLSREAADALVEATRHPKNESVLTHREEEVLALLTKGMTNTEIAACLSISCSTVKKHVSSIYSKLNTSSRTETVALVLQQKLIPIS